jgi:excisionase family DNA binding protein
MKKPSDDPSGETKPVHEHIPDYLTVQEAAQVIGVSPRSVYGYIKAGKLASSCIGSRVVVSVEDARCFERTPPGRMRTRPPKWHTPPATNSQHLTIIKVHMRPGQDGLLEHKLREIRMEQKHLLPGTAARYIICGRRDHSVVIIMLVWRSAGMPPKAKREAALAALYADLDEVLAWETADIREDEVGLHA